MSVHDRADPIANATAARPRACRPPTARRGQDDPRRPRPRRRTAPSEPSDASNADAPTPSTPPSGASPPASTSPSPTSSHSPQSSRNPRRGSYGAQQGGIADRRGLSCRAPPCGVVRREPPTVRSPTGRTREQAPGCAARQPPRECGSSRWAQLIVRTCTRSIAAANRRTSWPRDGHDEYPTSAQDDHARGARARPRRSNIVIRSSGGRIS